MYGSSMEEMGPCILQLQETVFVVKPVKQSWDKGRGYQHYLFLEITADCTLLYFSSFKVQDKSFGNFS